MDYKKKYKDALERAKRLTFDINTLQKIREFIFPELRESEDERIRKEIIASVECNSGLTQSRKAEIYTWLEKQKEQKPIEMEVYEVGKGTTICGQDYKCKKDFKEGNCWYIKDVIYHCGRDGYLTDQNGVSWSCTPKWFNEYIQSNTEWAEEEKTRFVGRQFLQCKLSFDGFKEGEHYWLEYVGDDIYVGRSDNILNQKFHITPRQLYTLFSQQLEEITPSQEFNIKPEILYLNNPSDEQIVDALIYCLSEQDGILTAVNCIKVQDIISWLNRKKEQKPVHFNEDYLAQTIKRKFEGFRSLLKRNGIDYEPQMDYWRNFARLFDSSAREYVKEQQEQEPAERATMRDFNYHEGEPDEKAWSRLFAILNYAEATSDDTPGEEIQALTNWIEEKQKPAEWSEEDERNIYRLEYTMRAAMTIPKHLIKWALDHLRPQPHWKPSQEQMKALDKAIPVCAGVAGKDEISPLISLYEQIKKL